MRIWLIQTWEPNPLDDPTDRPWRTGMLARALAARGHEVIWFASRFSHFKKRFRADQPGKFELGDGIQLRLLDALGYEKNVSLQRLKDHRFVADRLLETAKEMPRPDVIVASYPTIETCQTVAQLKRVWGVPCLMDIRDQYPDHYWQAAPALLRPIIQIACAGMRRAAQGALSAADAITGNGDDVVEFGLRYAGRARTEQDQTFFMTYERPVISAMDAENADAYWAERGIPRDHNKFVIVFAGSLGPTSSFASLVQAAPGLPENVKFVICGDGTEYGALVEATKSLPNILLTGRVTMPVLDAVFERAQAAYVPYLEVPNFQTAITNKMVESLAYGLPILTTLRSGLYSTMVKEYSAGEFTEVNDANALIGTLRRWSTDDALLQRYAMGAARLYREQLSPTVINERWCALIERLTS